ncbi:hypothetical protein PMZ80_005651 [Knufia obscura]|uniref:Uncharacterized protein n=1 Tax=Knufia obscura TaxID=1635080 RepID=A0ABR0RM64_9EURO|nr:hypothetical protein PMZ80_005651 [Knufia obscura]
MGYDPFSPLAPALINVLCLPAGRVTPRTFDSYLTWLQTSVGIVAQPLSKEQKSQSDHKGTESSHDSALLFRFSSHSNASFVQRTAFFEPNRQPQIVVGIIDGSSLPSEGFEAELRQAQSRVKQVFEQAGGIETPSKVIVFDATNIPSTTDAVFIRTESANSNTGGLIEWLSGAAASRGNRVLDVLHSQEVELPQSVSRSDRLNGAEPRPDSRAEDSRRQSIIPSFGRTNTETPPAPEDQIYASTSGKIVSAALVKLQMGQWTEALDRLVDGARAARDANSPAWHAKALEGMLVCLLLHAWAGREFQIPQDCYPTTRGYSSSSAIHSIADANRVIAEKFTGTNTNRLSGLTAMLPGLIATIMNLYERSAMGFDNGLPQILVCEARVSLAVLLVTVRRHEGLLNAAALDALVGSRQELNFPSSLEPSSAGLVLRSSNLSSLLVESITEAQAQLSIQAASTIYFVICQNLAELQLERKQGFYLKDILQKLPPALIEARKVGAAEAAVHPSINGLSAFTSGNKGHTRLAQGMRALLQLAVQAYELPDLSKLQHEPDTEDDQVVTKTRLSSWLSVFISGDIATKLEILRLCVRVSDALPDLIGSIQFMSLILFVTRQQVTLFHGSSNAVPLIAAEEQTRLANGISNAVIAAQRQGNNNILASYWDDFLVRGIELYESPSAGKLMPHSSKDLSLTTTSGTSKKDPFIYNPFSGDRKASGPIILVKDEVATFDVVLQNPLEIDIEVESISLISDGCAFAAQTHSVVVGPLAAQAFTLQGVAKESGTLKIIGCKAKIKNCYERTFTIYSGTWKPPQIIKRKQLQSLVVDLPQSQILELKVVDPLPQLQVCSTSLVQRSVMLLDGEKCKFSLILENPGSIPADLVLFSYQDSVSRQLQDALATKDLQPADSYEVQYQLMHRQAIKRITPESNGTQKSTRSAAAVEAQTKNTFDFEILGKPGLTEAVVLIDYAHLGKPRNEIEGTFYTRQIRFVVNVTVNGSVDIPRCGVLSIPETTTASSRNEAEAQTNGKASTAITTNGENAVKGQGQGQCLLQLDLRSLWQTPLSVTIETASPSSSAEVPPTWTTATSTTLLPTQISRTLTLLPRIYIPNTHEPIPSLTPSNNRQFVVSASKLSLEAELATREAFWYREEVCKRLRIGWKEEYTSGGRAREGEIDIRKGVRLSPRMIDALRVEHVQISFDLLPAREGDGDKVVRNGKGEFEVRWNVFARLIVKVQNLTQDDLRLLLRLQPSLADQSHSLAMDLSKKFVWSGVLQRVVKAGIKPGQTVESELGVVCLAVGAYQVNATVEEIRGRKREIEGVNGGDAERRIWHARRPALIRAVG